MQKVNNHQPRIIDEPQCSMTDPLLAEYEVEDGEFIPNSFEDCIDVSMIDLNK